MLVLGVGWDCVGILEPPLQQGDTLRSALLPPPHALTWECRARQSTASVSGGLRGGCGTTKQAGGQKGSKSVKEAQQGPTQPVQHDAAINSSFSQKSGKMV